MLRKIVRSRFWVNVSLAIFLIAIGGCDSKAKKMCIEDCKRKAHTLGHPQKTLDGEDVCRGLCELQEQIQEQLQHTP